MKALLPVREFWPEALGGLSAALVLGVLCLSSFYVSPEIIAGSSSLLAQVMATLLGLIFTAYVVFQGMQIESKVSKMVKQGKLPPGSKEEIAEHLLGVHNHFLNSLKQICTGTLITLIFFFISSNTKELDALEESSAIFVNALACSILWFLVTSAVGNVIASLSSLRELSNIDFD